MVNNIPVNGWPQLKDLEAVQPILNRLDKIEAWKRTVKEETFTGEEITIPNALALPARSLITEINAKQDLHGLPFPYVGGAYKNKLKVTATSTTISGVTFTVNSDGTVKVNGTATDTVVVRLSSDISLTQGADYKFNGCTTDTFNCRLDLTGNTTSSESYTNINNDTSFTAGQTSYRASIIVNSGYTVNNVIIKPMIRLATESDATFAPYSNICPISGRDSVVVTRSDGDEISEDFTIQLGTTVYGARINFNTGDGIVDKAITTFNGSSGFVLFDTVTDGKRYVLYSPFADAKRETAYSEVIASSYKCVLDMPVNNGEIAFRSSATPQWLMVVSDKATITDFNNELNANPLQVCYELATPTTIQLTPTQLEMLKGYNHITLSDGYGTIELKALTGANWS